MHMDANKLDETIKKGNKASTQNKAKSIILLRHHLSEDLKVKYLIWVSSRIALKDEYNHL